MKTEDREANTSPAETLPYFVGCGRVAAGSIARHRNVKLWRDEESGEWHAESLDASIQEDAWSQTPLAPDGVEAVIWRGSDVLFTGSPKLSERLTIVRVERLE